MNAVPDLQGDYAGPLAGLAGAVAYLNAMATPPELLVSGAVDTPFLPPDFVTRLVDGQSALLFKAAAAGQRLLTVALVDGPTTITLTDVLISSYSTGDSPPGNNGTRSENVTFKFARVDYTVNGVTACFDFTTNTSC